MLLYNDDKSLDFYELYNEKLENVLEKVVVADNTNNFSGITKDVVPNAKTVKAAKVITGIGRAIY